MDHWERLLAYFYESHELAHRLDHKSVPNGSDYDRERAVGGAILLSHMLDDDRVTILDLPNFDQVEQALIHHCGAIRAFDADPADRERRCAANTEGAMALVQWWGNLLLGLHQQAQADLLLAEGHDIVNRVNAIAVCEDELVRRCAYAAEAAAQAIRLADQRRAGGTATQRVDG